MFYSNTFLNRMCSRNDVDIWIPTLLQRSELLFYIGINNSLYTVYYFKTQNALSFTTKFNDIFAYLTSIGTILLSKSIVFKYVRL